MRRVKKEHEVTAILQKEEAEDKSVRHAEIVSALEGNNTSLQTIAQLLTNNATNPLPLLEQTNKLLEVISRQDLSKKDMTELKDTIKTEFAAMTKEIVAAINHRPKRIVLRYDEKGQMYSLPTY